MSGKKESFSAKTTKSDEEEEFEDDFTESHPPLWLAGRPCVLGIDDDASAEEDFEARSFAEGARAGRARFPTLTDYHKYIEFTVEVLIERANTTNETTHSLRKDVEKLKAENRLLHKKIEEMEGKSETQED